MFGYAAFAELPFATIGAKVIPPPPPAELLLGGHFGFDERDKGWEEEKRQEAKRRERIKTALFGLPPEQRKQITSAPAAATDIVNKTYADGLAAKWGA